MVGCLADESWASFVCSTEPLLDAAGEGATYCTRYVVQAYLDRCNSDLMGLTDLVQGQLTEAERLTLGALITVDVHASDVVRELQEAGLRQTSDFEWVSRLRYYWRDDVYVDMAQVRCHSGRKLVTPPDPGSWLAHQPRYVISCNVDLTSPKQMSLPRVGCFAGINSLWL